MPRRRNTNRRITRPSFWIVCILTIGALISGGWLWSGLSTVAPRFNFILIRLNNEPRKIISGEVLNLHPRDKVKILEISTNIPLNLGVRLVAEGIDVNALRYEEMKLSSLLPGQDLFNRYRFRIQVKYRNQEIGYCEWEMEPFVEDWFEKANRTIDPERRVALLERALRLAPEDVRIKQKLYEEYKSLKQWGKAAAVLEEMAGKNPGRETLLELKEIYSDMAAKEKVITVLKKILQLDPNDLTSRGQLAEVLENTKNFDAAIEQYETLLKGAKEGTRLMVLKHLGYLYTETDQTAKAIASYLEAAKLDQGDANLYYNLSYLYERTGEKEKADFYLQNAITLRSEDIGSRLKLARSLLERGKLDKAESFLSEVLKKNPKSLDALQLLMEVAEKQGDKGKLKGIYERILSLDPDNEVILYNLGALEYEAGNLDASLPYFVKYAASHPKDPEVRGLLFDIYRKQGNASMAFKEAEILAEIQPDQMDYYHYMFDYLKSQGNYAAIIQIAEKGLERNPQLTDLREYLVFSYLKTGRVEFAAKEMEEILKTRPKDVKLLLDLAKLREKQGELTKALAAYKRVIELAPGQEEAADAYLRLRLKGVESDGKE